jgi:hypothetical protein
VTAKGYILDTGKLNEDGSRVLKVASKGVPTKFGLEFLKTGTATFQKPMKMRESMRRGLESNIWNDVTKVSHSFYDKREVRPDGSTQPHNILTEV